MIKVKQKMLHHPNRKNNLSIYPETFLGHLIKKINVKLVLLTIFHKNKSSYI